VGCSTRGGARHVRVGDDRGATATPYQIKIDLDEHPAQPVEANLDARIARASNPSRINRVSVLTLTT